MSRPWARSCTRVVHGRGAGGTSSASAVQVSLDLGRLQDELRAAGARWNAGANPIADLPSLERRRRLACALRPEPPELQRRVVDARRVRARRIDLSGRVCDAHDLRARPGGDFVGAAPDPDGGVAWAAAARTAVEVSVRISRGDARLALGDEVSWLAEAGAAGQAGPCGPAPWPVCEPRDPRIKGWPELTKLDEIKRWLVTHGPLVSVLAVHEDFYAYLNGVYHHVAGAYEGAHCVAVIGFDEGGEYWVAQNSWGPRWGEDGYFRIGFGERGIDASMWGVELAVST
jgi:Papain family cysteine protease